MCPVMTHDLYILFFDHIKKYHPKLHEGDNSSYRKK